MNEIIFDSNISAIKTWSVTSNKNKIGSFELIYKDRYSILSYTNETIQTCLNIFLKTIWVKYHALKFKVGILKARDDVLIRK